VAASGLPSEKDVTMMRNECIGSIKPALPSDLLPLGRNDLARCHDCGATVAVWFADGQWIQCSHEVGVDTDERELAAMVQAWATASH
jgi:hypothetical protein